MLILFGDSFISEPQTKKHSTWFQMLANDLNFEYKTYGEEGSSFEYSTLKFFEYLTSDNYDENDQIVFVLTTIERSPVISKDFKPKWASLAFNKVFPDYIDESGRSRLNSITAADYHYNRFMDFYKDWYLLRNDDLILAQRYMLLQTLHNLPNKTVSISVSDNEATIAKYFPNHACCSLLQVSSDEISNSDLFDYLKTFGPYPDPRLNHLHEKNHHVLKEMVYTYLTDDFPKFNIDSFHKNLYSV